MSLSLYDLFVSMGLFAKSIVIILAAMSIYSWTSAFQKLYQIVRSQGETRRFAPEFSRFLQEEQLDGALKLAEKQKKSHVALAVVKPLLRDRATITAADINSVERAVEREILIVSAELKRGLGILATTGSTAPFVGLLGTVMGIVNAFTGMAASGGGGSLGAVSAGIAEALITTAFGLIVAIPAVWLYNYFTTKIDFLSVEMTYTSKELIDLMLVLLIIFMIVTPLIAAGFHASFPHSANTENRPEGEGEVKLGIDKDGRFWLDLGSGPKQIPDDQLPERLQTVYETHTQDKILFLKADQNIEFGRVQQAIEIARQAGVRVVGAITEQKQTLTKKKGES